MSTPSTIRFSPSSKTTVDLDISVEGAGLKRKSSAVVRLVVFSKEESASVYFCKNTDGTTWSTTVPAVSDMAHNPQRYVVEVVVDGYFFEPADGKIVVAEQPTVKAEVAKETEGVVEEASGGPEVTGQYAPTNGLLKPEYVPPRSQAKAPGTEKDDEVSRELTIDDLGDPVPGPSTDHHADGSPEEISSGEFDARAVASELVRNTMGSVKRPRVKGSLFKRDEDGRPIVSGLETPKQRAAREKKEAAIKDAIRSI